MLNLFLLSFIGSVSFAFTVGAIHVLRKDLPIESTVLSRYATGPYGRLLTAGIFSIGFAEILLSIGLAESTEVTLGNVLLLLAGTGAIIVATFKIELPKQTLGGYLHDLGAGVQFLFFPFALLQLRVVFLHSSSYVFTEVIALCNLLLLLPIAYLYFTNATHQEEFFGIIQKTNILLMTLWVMSISLMFI